MNTPSTDRPSNSPQRLDMRWGYYFFVYYMKWMPAYALAEALLVPLWWLINVCAVKARRVSLKNLDIAFGKTFSAKQKHQIVDHSFYVLMRSMLGILFYAQHPSLIRPAMQFTQKETLDGYLSHGNGLVVITAHLGCFPLMLFRLAQEGYKVNAIVNPGRDWKVQQHLWQGAARCGVNLIESLPAKQCIKEAMGALKRNEILVIVPDQNYGGGNRVFVDFFDRIAGTTSSPAIFAMRHQAPVLPMFAVEKEGQWWVEVDKCLPLPTEKMSPKVIRDFMQQMIAVIETYVRRYPEQYMWMHNRWKTQPNDEEKTQLTEWGVMT